MTQELNLTADQQAKIKPILDAAKTQMQAVHADTSMTKEQKRAKIKDVRKGVRGQVSGILTDDQKAKLATLHKGHHAKS